MRAVYAASTEGALPAGVGFFTELDTAPGDGLPSVGLSLSGSDQAGEG
jgi:hypothetical protein